MIMRNRLKFSFIKYFDNENIFSYWKILLHDKTRAMFSFLCLINNSATIELSFFLLLSISAIITSKTINTLHILLSCILQCFYKYYSYYSSIQQKLQNYLNTLNLCFHIYELKIDNLLSIDLLNINKFCQYLVADLLD